jgi:hypothetical protein
MIRGNVCRDSRVAALMVAAACMAWVAGSSAQPGSAGEFLPTFTIEEVMESIVMPSADVLWNAVSVEVSAEGIKETLPESDEDWERLRWAAVTLAEATNVLTIRGRAVAEPLPEEEVAEGDLSPAEIQALLETSWPAWVAHAHALHEAAVQTVRFVDAKDVDGLTEVGGTIDAACESCHLQFWYPEQ